MTHTDHWNSRTIRFLEPVLQTDGITVSIATSFFTVEGYNLMGAFGHQARLSDGGV